MSHATPSEELLSAIWRELLGRARIGAEESFFELGGDPPLAIRVLAQVHECFGVELPPRDLFDHPTLEALAGRIDAALRGAAAAVLPPVVPVPRDRPIPLSFSQKRLWLLARSEPASPAYNVPSALRLRGPLDTAALERACGGMVRRHESLRTTLVQAGGGPAQVAAPPRPVPLPRMDLAALPASAREAEARRLAAAEARAPFDIAHGPLARFRLVRLAAADHTLLVTLHSIVADSGSADLLVRELAAFYAGRPEALPALPVQLADYAAWQRQWLQGEVLESEAGYWRGRLAGAATLQLPTDRPRPAFRSGRGSLRRLDLPAPLLADLAGFSRRRMVTLFMTLLAGFQTLLARLAEQQDVVVGTPVSGRTHREIEGLVGPFANTLALRGDLTGDPTFSDLTVRVRESTLSAYAHQNLPLEALVQELRPEHDPALAPLFQVMFALRRAAPPLPSLPELEIAAIETHSGGARLDLTLTVTECGAAAVEYAIDLWDGVTAERLLGHFRTLLAGIAADPERPLPDLPLLDAAERQQILEAWNDTAVAAWLDAPIHELVARQAAQYPEALAVAHGGRSLSYGELLRRADHLARTLRGLGVGPESIVGLLADRSPELVIGALGVLRAGGAYLPLDSTYPAERLAFLLRDAGVAALLVQARHAAVVEDPGAPVLLLETLAEKEQEAPVQVAEEGLAYCIYTSGSTGLPKGVEVSHAALLNVVAWHRRAFAVTPWDRATLLAGVGFDASILEVWPCLTAGASLHVPDEETRSSPRRLRDWLVAEGITLTLMPTPMADGLLSLDWPSAPGLRTLLTGGDRLRTIPAGLPFTVVNGYGPTENSVLTTSGIALPDRVPPTIGRPLDNVRAYVTDAHGGLAPVGVPGELLAGGRNLARGYHGHPDLTAERFVPDPFSRRPGARLYRTGDRVRLTQEGEIDFLGRVDHQVKIRGVRIEPAEVEAALVRHPAVAEALVQVREDVPGDRRLVAYLVARGTALTATGLREHLRRTLPEPMVPAAFLVLPAFPLTSNGKVDRRALPAPIAASVLRENDDAGQERPSPRALQAAPPGERHGLLADYFRRILTDVLRLPSGKLDGETTFGSLGCDSVHFVELQHRFESDLGISLPVLQGADHVSIDGLAEIALGKLIPASSGAGHSPTGDFAPILLNAPADSKVFLFPPLLGYGVLYHRLPRHLEECALYSFDFIEADDRIDRYVDHILTIQPEGGHRMMGYSAGGLLAYEVAQTLERRGSRVSALVLVDAVPWQELEGRPVPYSKNTRSIDLFLDYIGEGEPQKRARLKEEILSRSRLFWDYLKGTSYQGRISAAIHLIRSSSFTWRGDEWTDLTSGEVRVYEVPGEHGTLMAPQHLPHLASLLREIFTEDAAPAPAVK